MLFVCGAVHACSHSYVLLFMHDAVRAHHCLYALLPVHVTPSMAKGTDGIGSGPNPVQKVREPDHSRPRP